jgi:hypothetical protein
MRPSLTAGPGEFSRDSDPDLSALPDRTERLFWLTFVAVSPGDAERENGLVKVTSDLLLLRPPVLH